MGLDISITDKTGYLLTSMDSCLSSGVGFQRLPLVPCVSLQLLDLSGAQGILGEGWRGGRDSVCVWGIRAAAIGLFTYSVQKDLSILTIGYIIYYIETYLSKGQGVILLRLF